MATAENILDTGFEDAANLRNQLAYGTLKLEATPYAVSPEQARALLPLWQAMAALSGTESVQEELNAVQAQIVETMQVEQLRAVAEMRITNADLSAFYAEKGVVLPTPQPGVTRVPGAMKDLPEEARQATRAAREASGEGTQTGTGKVSRTLLFEDVISLISVRSQE